MKNRLTGIKEIVACQNKSPVASLSEAQKTDYFLSLHAKCIYQSRYKLHYSCRDPD